MNWAAVGAIAGSVAALAAVAAWFTRNIKAHIDAAILANNAILVAQIEGRFMPSQGSRITGHEIEHRLRTLELSPRSQGD